MARRIQIGVIGLIHDQAWRQLEQIDVLQEAELVAAADPNQPLLDRVRGLHGCDVYLSCEKMLDTEQLDAVMVFGDNAASAELCGWALDRGLHAMIERPMGHSLDAAETMIAAARHGGGRLMAHWSIAFWPQVQAAIELARSGELGDIYLVKYRAAHPGPREMGFSSYHCEWLLDPRRGGGALLEGGGFGVVLAEAILGKPQGVSATIGNYHKSNAEVEDNAIIMMHYPRANAIAEASWSQVGELTCYTAAIYGTQGTLVVEPYHGGRLWRADADQPAGQPTLFSPNDPSMASGPAHFIARLRDDQPFHPMCQAETARNVHAVLQAARRSSEQQKPVSLGEEMLV